MLALLLVALPAVAGAGTERQQLSIVRVARGFDQPVYVAATPSEPARLYIVEQPGRIFVLEKGKRRLFMDIRGRVGSDGSEQGLLSMAFHPSYAKNRRFYVNYTDKGGDTRVVEFRSDGRRARLRTARRAAVREPAVLEPQRRADPVRARRQALRRHGGRREPGETPRTTGRRLDRVSRSCYGRIRSRSTGRRSASACATPGASRSIAGPAIFTSATSASTRSEEIDFRPRGAPPANFGWARYEGSRTYDGDIALDPASPLVFPIHEYGHGEGCSVTGGYVYRGKDVPAAVGRYFFGDYCSGTVWSLRVVGGEATGVRREFDVSSLTSFGEGARGELYLVSHEGSIYRLAR